MTLNEIITKPLDNKLYICHSCTTSGSDDAKYHNIFDNEHNKFIFLCNNCFEFYLSDLQRFKLSWIKDHKDKYKEFYELAKQDTPKIEKFGCVTLDDGRVININTWEVKQ